MKKEIYLLMLVGCNLVAISEMEQQRKAAERKVRVEKVNKIIADLNHQFSLEKSQIMDELKTHINSFESPALDDAGTALQKIKTKLQMQNEQNKKLLEKYQQLDELSSKYQKNIQSLEADLIK